MSFGESIKTCLTKYVDFKGRASRAEYWWFFLFDILVYLGLILLAGASDAFAVLFIVALLALFLPTLAAAVRRLHDTGKSGAWYFIALIPYIGGIVLMVLLAQEGKREVNAWGPPPGLSTIASSTLPNAPATSVLAPPRPDSPPAEYRSGWN